MRRPPPPTASPPTLAGVFLAGVVLLAAAQDAPGQAAAAEQAAKSREAALQETEAAPFRHEDHELLDCMVCHQSGQPTVRTNRSWCSDCHHGRRTAASCYACHSRGELDARTLPVTRRLGLSVGETGDRRLSFRHALHDTLACNTCHTDPPELSAAGLECGQCHEEHHALDADCAACHAEPPASAHPVRAHLTCAGSGCHARTPFPEPPPRERGVCLACHQDQRDHHPDRNCVACHVLPPPGTEPPGADAAGRGGGPS